MVQHGRVSASPARTTGFGTTTVGRGRTELLRGTPFLDAYLRVVLCVLGAAVAYAGLAVWHFQWHFEGMFSDIYVPLGFTPRDWNELALIEETSGYYVPMFDVDASTLEMFVQSLWTVLTWRPIVALLVGLGLVSVLLEQRSHR